MQSISPLVISDENFNQVIDENPVVVVDFWAEWCGPCRAMNPIIEELSLIYENKIVFAKLNVDKNPISPSKYGISSIPTFLIIKNGQVMNSIIGAITQELFEEKLNEYL
jgi:thioredoxin 1|tara:strand:- start:1731 stop:2057 length:327 start_codon:yes stop_codon:yes gene_type:complete